MPIARPKASNIATPITSAPTLVVSKLTQSMELVLASAFAVPLTLSVFHKALITVTPLDSVPPVAASGTMQLTDLVSSLAAPFMLIATPKALAIVTSTKRARTFAVCKTIQSMGLVLSHLFAVPPTLNVFLKALMYATSTKSVK
jgi:hypothetical protein